MRVLEDKKLIFLGHAGFIYKTAQFLLLMDPWVDSDGAYFKSWYQFPCNHHIEKDLINLLEKDTRDKFIYISHNDKDHMDLAFLKKINKLQIKFLIPDFSKKIEILSKLKNSCGINIDKIHLFKDNSYLKIHNHILKFYIIDSERESDSSILIKSNKFNFLNSNDCKLHDKIPAIIKEEGNIDILAMQFSGAAWHPIAYKNFYGENKYNKLSLTRKLNRFRTLSNTINNCKIRNYIPSAGPPCFLDPLLFNTNFEKNNIFPDSQEVSEFLNQNNKELNIINLNPGDILNFQDLKISKYFQENPCFKGLDPYENKHAYLKKYQSLHIAKFKINTIKKHKQLINKFCKELNDKLNSFDFNEEININLYFQILKVKTPTTIEVNFKKKLINIVDKLPNKYYLIEIKEEYLNEYLKSNLNFHDFLLSCRQNMSRNPDQYDYLIDSFICLDSVNLKKLKKKFNPLKEQISEKFQVEFQSKIYSIDRFCPHERADLKHSLINENGLLVCPRHCWEFDLNNKGKCTKVNKFSINASIVSTTENE